MSIYRHPNLVALALLLGGFLAVASLTGCVSAPPPPVVVSGNGKCHPSDDLPAHKSVPLAPEFDTPIARFVQMVVDWRRGWAADDRDYNSLYAQCVEPTAPAHGK
jgi:hypothetical protein